jgi:hypothetical protein
MPSHIDEALALIMVASIGVAFITAAFTVVQPCAVGWQ